MTEQNKDLLLKYLSMALPYGVKVLDTFNENYGVSKLINIGIDGSMLVDNDLNDIQYYPVIAGTKPYLRTLSSMTDEEKKEYNLTKALSIVDYPTLKSFGWLLEHHFDFMDLIPKYLAIEVTENNNPYKE